MDPSKQETSDHPTGRARSLEEERRQLKVVYVLFLVTIPLYFILGSLVEGVDISKWWLGLPLAFLLSDLLRAPTWIRELRRAQVVLVQNPHETKSFATYRLSSFRLFLMGETFALAGFVSQILSLHFIVYGSLYLVGLAVLLLSTPRLLYRRTR